MQHNETNAHYIEIKIVGPSGMQMTSAGKDELNRCAVFILGYVKARRASGKRNFFSAKTEKCELKNKFYLEEFEKKTKNK